MVNLKLKKDRPMTSKVRADAGRKQGINRPMTAKVRAPIVENIREQLNDGSEDYGTSTQNISPKNIRTFKAIHIKGEKDHDDLSSLASGSKLKFMPQFKASELKGKETDKRQYETQQDEEILIKDE